MNKQIALLGTGAIGASVARALYLNHVPFTILVRDQRRKDNLLTRGISYRLKDVTHIELGNKTSAYQVLTIKEGKKYDYIFLGMKTPHLKVAASTAKHPPKADGSSYCKMACLRRRSAFFMNMKSFRALSVTIRS
ncbi:MAG: 2-dehydropantoate 2-reductase N-terminal domain-containing protein [Turneriella sp.]